MGQRELKRSPFGLGWVLILALAGCAHGQVQDPEGPADQGSEMTSDIEGEAEKTVSEGDESSEEAKDSQAAPMEFVSYQMVLLMAGPQAESIPEEEQAALQAAHLGHLRAMSNAGHMVVAGPFSDQDDPSIRGLCLYQTEGIEEARALAESDPAVQAGRLQVQVMTWWTQKGAISFPWMEKSDAL